MNLCIEQTERKLGNEQKVNLDINCCQSLEPIHRERFYGKPSVSKGFEIGYKPMKEAIMALEPDKTLEVIHRKSEIIFNPLGSKASKGILFFTGGLVDKRSYAPLARKLAKEGNMVIISDVEMGSVLKNKSGKLMNEFANISKWYVGGHSQGGVAATEVAFVNASKVEGVILLASYPIFAFKNKNIKFLDIRAENDKVLPGKVADVSYRMTVSEKDLTKVNIVGGNHGNFGYYGDQLLDGKATISRDAQQKITFESIMKFINEKK